MIHMFVTFVLFFYHLNFVVYFSLWVNIRFLAAFKWPTWQMQYVCSMYTSLLCLVDAKHKFILQWGGRYKMTRRTNVSITSAKLQHSGMVVIRCFAFFFSTHLYTRGNHIWKEPKGKTHNSKQRQRYKCFGSGKIVTCENIHSKCCDGDLKMKQ